jgi:hypothetical protein
LKLRQTKSKGRLSLQAACGQNLPYAMASDYRAAAGFLCCCGAQGHAGAASNNRLITSVGSSKSRESGMFPRPGRL